MEENLVMLLIIEYWHLVPSKLAFTVRESQREVAIACEAQANKETTIDLRLKHSTLQSPTLSSRTPAESGNSPVESTQSGKSLVDSGGSRVKVQ